MYGEMTAEELRSKLAAGENVNLVDVREPDEWQDGHIKEARSIPLSQFVERVHELHREDQEDQEIVLICRSGNRSGKACDYLATQGYTVINVLGGMLAWQGEVATGE